VAQDIYHMVSLAYLRGHYSRPVAKGCGTFARSHSLGNAASPFSLSPSHFPFGIANPPRISELPSNSHVDNKSTLHYSNESKRRLILTSPNILPSHWHGHSFGVKCPLQRVMCAQPHSLHNYHVVHNSHDLADIFELLVRSDLSYKRTSPG